MEDREDAITDHRQALVLRPPGHPHRSDPLSNLANALSTRFDQLGKMEDLEEAIRHLLDSDAALLVEHPAHITIRKALGRRTLTLHDRIPGLDGLLSVSSRVQLAICLPAQMPSSPPLCHGHL
jgi:hypothetical protein